MKKPEDELASQKLVLDHWAGGYDDLYAYIADSHKLIDAELSPKTMAKVKYLQENCTVDFLS